MLDHLGVLELGSKDRNRQQSTIVSRLHHERWHEQPDDLHEKSLLRLEQLYHVPDLEAHHHRRAEDVEDADAQQPRFKLHRSINYEVDPDSINELIKG